MACFGNRPKEENAPIQHFVRALPFYGTIQLLINTHWKIGWPGHTILTILGSTLGQSPVRGNIQKLKFHGSSAFLQDNLTVDKCTLEDRLARRHNSEFVSSFFGPWVRSNARISKPPACQPAPCRGGLGNAHLDPPRYKASSVYSTACRMTCVSPTSVKLLFKSSILQSILGIVYYFVIDIPWGGHSTAIWPMCPNPKKM